MSAVIVAIHQPNFMPWLGYFHKLATADVFVLLDGVDFPKNSWLNRVRVDVNGSARWLTCPVSRASVHRPIVDAVIPDAARDWADKACATLTHAYRRAAHFDAEWPWIEPLLRANTASIAELNQQAISTIAQRLGLDTRLVRQSRLADPAIAARRGSARLAAICTTVGGTAYLAGDGAGDYEDPAVYEKSGLGFRTVGFEHPVYDQGRAGAPFLAGLSIVDAILHLGAEGAAHLLRPHPA